MPTSSCLHRTYSPMGKTDFHVAARHGMTFWEIPRPPPHRRGLTARSPATRLHRSCRPHPAGLFPPRRFPPLFFHLLVSICICGEMIPCGDVFCRKNDPRQEKPSEDAPPRGIFCLSPQDLTCLHTGAFAFFHGYGAVHQHIVHTLRQTAGVFVGGGLVQLF